MEKKITFPVKESLYREFKALVIMQGKKVKIVGDKLVSDYVKKNRKDSI